MLMHQCGVANDALLPGQVWGLPPHGGAARLRRGKDRVVGAEVGAHRCAYLDGRHNIGTVSVQLIANKQNMCRTSAPEHVRRTTRRGGVLVAGRLLSFCQHGR